MKKAIAIFVCALLGLVAGYFAAPAASFLFIQSTQRDMFGAFALSLVDSSVACNCDGQPPSESLKTVKQDLSILQRWRDQNRNSRVLGQEIGLTQVRLSRLEGELGDNTQADADMAKAQEELAALGWRDTSAAHLIALTKQLNSEYKPADQKNKTVGESQGLASIGRP